jgi:hypothetical protein
MFVRTLPDYFEHFDVDLDADQCDASRTWQKYYERRSSMTA